MAYCSNCGNELKENQDVCLKCGSFEEKKVVNDEGGFLWGLLGFCIPIVGLILFLIWKDERPKTSKASGIGAAISVAAIIIFYILYFIFIFGVIALSAI